MQKTMKHISAVLGRVLLIGVWVQIVLGVGQVLRHLGIYAEYGTGSLYEKAAQSLDFTGCAGILYPFIVKAAMGMGSVLHIPYYCIVYIFQLLFAGVAGYLLLASVFAGKAGQSRGKRRCYLLLGAGAMLTVPTVLQCHLSVLPNSMAISLFVLELAFGLRLLGDKNKAELGQMLLPYVCWLLSGMCMREYALFGAVPILVLLLVQGKEAAGVQERRGLSILLAGLALLAVLGVSTLQEKLTDTEDISLRQALLTRGVWSSLAYAYEQWPAQLQEAVTWDVAMEAHQNPERMRTEFLDALEAVDEETKNTYYKALWKAAYQIRGLGIVKETAYDLAGYVLPEFILVKQLEGEGYHSITGINYQVWSYPWGKPATVYMRFYSGWFLVATLLGVLRLVCSWVAEKKERKQAEGNKKIIGSREGYLFLCGILFMTIMSIYYTLTEVGSFDYKLAAGAAVLWCVWWLALNAGAVKEEALPSEEECK